MYYICTMNEVFVDIHTHQTPCHAISPTASGVHPWQVAELTESELATVLDRLRTAPVDVIGEIGLDYARDVDRGLQKKVFETELKIASERGLPVVLHCVRAFEDVMAMLAGFSLRAVVFHGFIGSPEQAIRAVKRGYFLSFGVRSFASPRTVESLRQVPTDHIFLETDDDPTPIEQVYEMAAEVLGISVPQLAEQTRKNYGVAVAN